MGLSAVYDCGISLFYSLTILIDFIYYCSGPVDAMVATHLSIYCISRVLYLSLRRTNPTTNDAYIVHVS